MFLGKYLKDKNININRLVVLSLVSIVIYHLMLVNNNSFILGSNIAFPEIIEWFDARKINYGVVRLFLVELAWIIRCLPYLFIAMCINYWLAKVSERIIHKNIAIVDFYFNNYHKTLFFRSFNRNNNGLFSGIICYSYIEKN